MQCQHVQSSLDFVAVLGHGGIQSQCGVLRVIGPQVIRFVVEYPIATFVLEYQVGKAHQHAVQLRIGPAALVGTNLATLAAALVAAVEHWFLEPLEDIHPEQEGLSRP